MAGNLLSIWLCGRVSLIAIILQCVLTVITSAREIPCGSYIPNENWEQYRSEGDVMLFLRERCDSGFNMMEIEEFILSERSNSGLIIDILPATLICDARTHGLEALVHMIGQGKARAIIATLDSDSCEIAGKFAHLWDVPLLTWSCPLKDSREQLGSSMIRLSPSFPALANALAQLFLYLGWKTAVLISMDCEPWSSLERAVASAFHTSGILVRQKIAFAQHASPGTIHQGLKPIRKLARKATVLCLPATTEQSTTAVLTELDLTIRSSKHRFTIVLLHAQEDDLFLPRSDSSTNVNQPQDENNRTTSNTTLTEVTEATENMSTEFFQTMVSNYYITDGATTNNLPNSSDNPPTNSTRSRSPTHGNIEEGTPPTRNQGISSDLDIHLEGSDDENNEGMETLIRIGQLATENQSNIAVSASLEGAAEHHLAESEENATLVQFDEYADPSESPSFPADPVRSKGAANKFVPPGNLSKVTINSLLVLAPLDQRYDIEKIYKGSMYYEEANLLNHLNESLFILRGQEDTLIDETKNKMYNYALINLRENSWNPILVAVQADRGLSIRRVTTELELLTIQNLGSPGDAGCDLLLENQDFTNPQVDCTAEDDANDMPRSHFPIEHIVSVTLGSLLVTLVAIATAIFVRGQLLRRRMSKGPCKIILTTSDFVFPQLAQVDSRGVDEGIETMLCCWLQQLQEFGGPEVDKPDLLQLGSIGSLRPYLQNSCGNLARSPFLKDPRARYNGDLVQLKELPYQGTFELRAKAMATLVTLHGLRHENLNPLIGCLNEPTRPCLVYDYCSRGSLEDVLVQDEIKLDWSFRLSLLTDLVRGMRYLHGTPIRVHGYLTSRNCVIDARWVLKLTDYGLPAFYETQGICSPSRTSRDLLWTAPELLRQPNLRKKGTQPGDVYSFGIIMQEVVVRGEPFCMLALSPDEIIEKVMKPPPLIRPSVSKGAAPPEAINIMRQCWAESADMRPDFNNVHDLFKKLNHGRKVNFMDTMFQMLEKYSNNLEELIRERTEQLDMEKKKTEQLLNRMLPSSVADKLKLGMPVDPEEFGEVTIYFSDIVGFTTISAHSTPFQVVDLLNDLYTCFDATINAYTVYKVETIGDAYMVVAGCPVRIADHATQIATMALDLLHQSGKFQLRHLPKTQLRLRIGLHTGPCCAGVVGLTMPRYCLFGDTVNTASRMESTGAPWRIHMSKATRDKLYEAGGYHIEYRGKTDIKGKGPMPTYWLLGKQGFDKELPVPPPLGEDHGLNEDDVITGALEGKEEELGKLGDTVLGENSSSGSSSSSSSGSGPQRKEDHVCVGRVRMAQAPSRKTVTDKETGINKQLDIATDAGKTEAPNSDDTATIVEIEETTSLQSPKDEIVTIVSTPAESNANEGIEDDEGEHRRPTGRRSASQLLLPRELNETTRVKSGSGSGSGSRECLWPATGLVSKTTGSDAQDSTIYCPVSCPMAELPITGGGMLGASTTSLTSISSGVASAASSLIPSYKAVASSRQRKIPPYGGIIDENDLSTPYNHYRCLSPNEHSRGRTAGSSRLLRRQFSLDRPDESSAATTALGFLPGVEHHQHHSQYQPPQQRINIPRLHKQNSAGAANDLERIDEIPPSPRPTLRNFRHAASVSLSVESLSFH